MKGIRQRYPGSFSIIIELGYEVDPATGKRTRRQRWVTFRGTRKEAEAKRIELLAAVNTGTFAEPSKITLIEWLRTWLKTSVAPPMRRPATHRVYASIIEKHIAPSRIALIPLQRLRGTDLERYLADVPGAAASVAVHHAILCKALRRAVKDRLLTMSPAHDLERRRDKADHAQAAREHCWSAIEARRFIEATKTASPQLAAFMLLALDSGARKSELAGLGWEHVDLDAGTLEIRRQLDRAGVAPVFGPTKTKRSRTLSLGAETIAALRVHKREQLELKMRNRTSYTDFGLVFAKEPADLQRPEAALGQPLSTLGNARFVELVAKAGVKRIKFHGLRHTCATLLLQAGTPVHVVARRLGHANVGMTLNVYAHATRGMQEDAAARLGALLHG
ncbi:MAG: site-specific integrase [Acidobacteria bacterium]|nr:site-specific integrase [Acidobacteriota bacterium]